MALRPIPFRILTHRATLRQPATVDADRRVTYLDTHLRRVCLQMTNETRKTADNTETLLRAVLYYDHRLSVPAGLDFDALKARADALGSDLKILHGGMTYTVEAVDSCVDDTGRPHHTEVGLI